jgi:xanthine dehydrogenase accessory factor
VGLLGSRPKVVHIFTALEERGIAKEQLARINAPMGLEIGAQTPDEIAVSILAELIAVRRGQELSSIRTMKMELPGRMAVGDRSSDILK